MNCLPSKIKAKHYQLPSASQKYEQRIKSVKNNITKDVNNVNNTKIDLTKLVKEEKPIFIYDTFEEQLEKWIKKRREIDVWRRNVGEAMLHNGNDDDDDDDDSDSKNSSTLIDSSTLTTTSTLKSAGELKKKLNEYKSIIPEEINISTTPTKEKPLTNAYCLIPKSPSIPIFTTKTNDNDNDNKNLNTKTYWNPIKSFKKPIQTDDNYFDDYDDEVFDNGLKFEPQNNMFGYNNIQSLNGSKYINKTNNPYPKLTPQPVKRNMEYYFNSNNNNNNTNNSNTNTNNNNNYDYNQYYNYNVQNNSFEFNKRNNGNEEIKPFQNSSNDFNGTNHKEKPVSLFRSNSQYQRNQDYGDMQTSTMSRKSIHKSESNVRLVLRNNSSAALQKSTITSNYMAPQSSQQQYYIDSTQPTFYHHFHTNPLPPPPPPPPHLPPTQSKHHNNTKSNHTPSGILYKISSSYQNLNNTLHYPQDFQQQQQQQQYQQQQQRSTFPNVVMFESTKSPLKLPKVGDTLSMRFSFGSEPALNNATNTIPLQSFIRSNQPNYCFDNTKRASFYNY